MKIGILTFHRAHNYGAVLQCYALQEVLKGMGHEVEVIDYRQAVIEKAYNHWNMLTLMKRLVKFWELMGYIKILIIELIKRRIFDSFKCQYLNIHHTCDAFTIPCDYDAYVVGSDQLFTTEITGGLDKVYSGQFDKPDKSKLVGYAISSNAMAVTEIGKKAWKSISTRFNALSMREDSLVCMIENLANVRFDVCVDPTLLTTESHWNHICKCEVEDTDYVVMYEVRKLHGNPNMLKQKAKSLANANNLRVVNLSSMRYYVDDWVNLIKNSRCVITSSFHATVFALIFKRPLYAFCLNDGRDYRYTDLLNKVGANKIIMQSSDTPMTIPILDYEKIANNMEQIKLHSMNFLKKHLS